MNEQMSVVLGTVAMEPKGEYSAEAYYEKLNTVLYNDSTYMAIKPSHNILPTDTEYWQLIGGGVTREDIVDNLESNDSDKPLSANQGRVLNESIFLDGITYTENYDSTSNTTYYIIEISRQNEDSEKNVWKLGIANDNSNFGSLESTIEFAKRKSASICINAGLFKPSTGLPHGVLIQNGVILQDAIPDLTFTTNILGIKENGELLDFPSTTPAQTILDNGCVNALLGYKAIIKDGQSITDTSNEPYPQQIICRKQNGDYLILTCDGRTKYDTGMTIADCQRVLQNYNVDYAFRLDGGGSTSTVIDLQKINKNIDEQYKDRVVQNYLYMTKSITRKDLNNIYGIVSDLRQDMIKRFIKYQNNWTGYYKLYAPDENPGIEFYQNGETETRSGKITLNNNGFYVRQKEGDNAERILIAVLNNFLYYKGVPFGNFANYCTNTASSTDLDNIEQAGFYLSTSSTTNKPQQSNFIVLHINNTSSLTNQTQYAFPMNNTSFIYCRRKIDGGSWGAWTPINIYACSTANRPTGNLATGTQIWDYSLKKPLWYYQGNWYDATGTQV